MDLMMADTPDGGQPSSTLDRRAALKAALGGAAAAAILSGPQISGMSVLPSYASAASADQAITVGSANYGNCPNRLYCWGSINQLDGTCPNPSQVDHVFLHTVRFSASGSVFDAPSQMFGQGKLRAEIVNYLGQGECYVELVEGVCRANGGSWTGSAIGSNDTLTSLGDFVEFDLGCSGSTNCPQKDLNPYISVYLRCVDD